MSEPTVRNLQPSETRYEPLPFDGMSPPATPVNDSMALPMQELPAGAARPRFQGIETPVHRHNDELQRHCAAGVRPRREPERSPCAVGQGGLRSHRSLSGYP